ncbi:hypothetical protein V501_04521 [Pseudogymnoascus sp. VKM F-4519 (FW-2642)]|nr:hypothetical protein V501_04521 [Pseudogymnoascus sp. VKM F-4519 (FW-2642)]
MGSSILFTACCWLHLAFLTFAQDNNTPTPTPTGNTPEMSAAQASASKEFAALFTDPVPPSNTPSGDDAGAAGPSSGSVTISRGGIIAIGVVVGFVVVFGVVSSVLFYLAKKRSWEIRASIRKSAKRVATALTPRRSEFPKNVRNPKRNSRGMSKIDEVPPTPRITNEDLEKANIKADAIEMKAPSKFAKWGRKTER